MVVSAFRGRGLRLPVDGGRPAHRRQEEASPLSVRFAPSGGGSCGAAVARFGLVKIYVRGRWGA